MFRRPASRLDLHGLFAPLRAADEDVDVRAEVFRRLRSDSAETLALPTPSPTRREFLPAIGIPALLGGFALVKLSGPVLASQPAWGGAAAGCARAALLFGGALLESARSAGAGLGVALLRTAAGVPAPAGSLSFTAATAVAITILAAVTILAGLLAARDLRLQSPERSSPR